MKKKLLKWKRKIKVFLRQLKYEFSHIGKAEPPPICVTKHKWKNYRKDKSKLQCKKCGVVVARVSRMRWEAQHWRR